MPDWSEWIHHLLVSLDEPGSEVARRRRDLERARAAFGTGAVDSFHQALGDDDPTTVQAHTNLASLLTVSGRQGMRRNWSDGLRAYKMTCFTGPTSPSTSR